MTDNNNLAIALRALPLIDLTSLNENDNETTITELCHQAKSFYGNVAAVCVYPKFVSLAKKLLAHSDIKIATVANFPSGQQSIAEVQQDIEQSINAGANEIDVVLPYQDYLVGKIMAVLDFLENCRKSCGKKILMKVILETGALQQPEIIAHASRDAIYAGADFIKTSTGKIATGATLEAAEIMLREIHNVNLNRTVGFKASGGIRTLAQAQEYLQLADKVMGPDWVAPNTFRFGTSRLLDEIIKALQ